MNKGKVAFKSRVGVVLSLQVEQLISPLTVWQISHILEFLLWKWLVIHTIKTTKWELYRRSPNFVEHLQKFVAIPTNLGDFKTSNIAEYRHQIFQVWVHLYFLRPRRNSPGDPLDHQDTHLIPSLSRTHVAQEKWATQLVKCLLLFKIACSSWDMIEDSIKEIICQICKLVSLLFNKKEKIMHNWNNMQVFMPAARPPYNTIDIRDVELQDGLWNWQLCLLSIMAS